LTERVYNHSGHGYQTLGLTRKPIRVYEANGGSRVQWWLTSELGVWIRFLVNSDLTRTNSVDSILTHESEVEWTGCRRKGLNDLTRTNSVDSILSHESEVEWTGCRRKGLNDLGPFVYAWFRFHENLRLSDLVTVLMPLLSCHLGSPFRFSLTGLTFTSYIQSSLLHCVISPWVSLSSPCFVVASSWCSGSCLVPLPSSV